MSNQQEEQVSSGSHREQMMRGMAWLTAGSFISRLLGVIYVIPWMLWLQPHANEANALFNMGYQVYSQFLIISTVGIPTAVAKQVAKYNTLKNEEVSFYLVREFLKLMLVFGAICAGIMFVSSPLLADWSGSKKDLIPVMYSLVPNLLLFPAMSVLRGFFQGLNNMKPYAVSQVAEQIIRVIWILVVTFYIMKFGSGNYHEAVVQSTFAAFIGMIASVAVLIYALYRENLLPKLLAKKPSHVEIDLRSLIIETVKEALPIIILGSAFTLFQNVDQFSFVKLMRFFTGSETKELLILYSYMIANPSKITMLIIGITGSIGSVAIPLITERFVKGDKKSTADLVTDNLQMLFIFVIPAIVGTVLLARPLYSVFYPQVEDTAVALFIANLLLIFIQGLYAVLGVVIQAIFENRRAMKYFVIGLGVKLVLQIPAIYLFHAYGTLLSTAIGLGVTTYLFYHRISKVLVLDTSAIYKDTATISAIALFMGVIVWLVEWVLRLVVPPVGFISSLIHLAISGSIGVLIFGALTLKTRQLDKLIGGRAQRLREKMHMS